MPKIPPTWLSVIIPTYNGARYLAASLESVVGQHTSGVEYIAIDDGSSDATIQILESYLTELPLKIIRNSHAGSWAANSNLAVDKACGNYICFLHQDDLWLENRLEVLQRLVMQYPDCGFLLTTARYVSQSGCYIGRLQCPFPKREQILSRQYLLSRLLVQNFISIPAPVIKRQLFVEAGGMDARLWYTADWDLWLKVAAISPCCYSPQPTVAFRVHPASQTVTKSMDIAGFKKQLDSVLEKHLADLPAGLQERYFIEKCGRFSNLVNSTLAARLHGQKIDMNRLLAACWKLGLSGILNYFRNSRILERLLARLRARVGCFDD